MLIFSAILAIELAISWYSSLQLAHDWAMYILGLYSSWGTSRICPAWSPSEQLLTLVLFLFGARIRSHAVRKRLFIVLMTAAHISPNVFSLQKFLSNTQGLFLTAHNNIIHTYYTSHLYARLHLYFIRLVHLFISSDLHGRLAALSSLSPIHFWTFVLFWS
jgi:hypothetical protein